MPPCHPHSPEQARRLARRQGRQAEIRMPDPPLTLIGFHLPLTWSSRGDVNPLTALCLALPWTLEPSLAPTLCWSPGCPPVVLLCLWFSGRVGARKPALPAPLLSPLVLRAQGSDGSSSGPADPRGPGLPFSSSFPSLTQSYALGKCP